MLCASELLPDRAAVYQANFPETWLCVGDIRKLKSDVIERTRALLAGRRLDVLFATPPCQGMSKNGRGKLLNGIAQGGSPTSMSVILSPLRLSTLR
ncbi:MAG: DNA cytosine methyltransferase [Planctomycetes bacterium]|nr:DNA cytosine methyltransferase [Planctomycetota bacterium]